MAASHDELGRVQLRTGEVRLMTLDEIDRAFDERTIDGRALVLAPCSTEWTTLAAEAWLDDEVTKPELTPSLSPVAVSTKDAPPSIAAPSREDRPSTPLDLVDLELPDDEALRPHRRGLVLAGIASAAVTATAVAVVVAHVGQSAPVDVKVNGAIGAPPPRAGEPLPPPREPVGEKPQRTPEQKKELLGADKAREQKAREVSGEERQGPEHAGARAAIEGRSGSPQRRRPARSVERQALIRTASRGDSRGFRSLFRLASRRSCDRPLARQPARIAVRASLCRVTSSESPRARSCVLGDEPNKPRDGRPLDARASEDAACARVGTSETSCSRGDDDELRSAIEEPEQRRAGRSSRYRAPALRGRSGHWAVPRRQAARRGAPRRRSARRGLPSQAPAFAPTGRSEGTPPAVPGGSGAPRSVPRPGAGHERARSPEPRARIDFGEQWGGFMWLAMELLEGRSLERVLAEEGRLPVARAVDVMLDVCAGLAHAHERGIVHGDIKPSNVILVPRVDDDNGMVTERAKLCDFGVAHGGMYGGELESGPRPAVGSPAYMSPEQVLGEGLDARSDVYSCGALFYELVAGEPPFAGAERGTVLREHVLLPCWMRRRSARASTPASTRSCGRRSRGTRPTASRRCGSCAPRSETCPAASRCPRSRPPNRAGGAVARRARWRGL